MSDYPMLISNKLHSFRNFSLANVQKNKLPLLTTILFQWIQLVPIKAVFGY